MKLKSNLDEILYQKILESLIRGQYAVGEKVMLDELCEQFEVSRTPVVQAVKMLAKDGVLTVLSNGRAYVPDYGPAVLRQVCEARVLFEQHALGTVMQDVGLREKALEAMGGHAELCREHLKEKRYVELALEDLKLHRSLVRSAGNDILTDLYPGIQGRFIVANYLARPLRDRDYEGTVRDHFALLELIRKNDAQGARERLLQHIGGIMAVGRYGDQ